MDNWYWWLLAICGFIILGFILGNWRRKSSTHSNIETDKFNQALQAHRQELSLHLKNLADSLNQQLINQQSILNQSIKDLRQDNHQQLDRMRQTVDEKLQSTLDTRLTESFKRVDQQLAAVNKSMGDMQALAADVGQLQKTLSGVKTKGIWGEAHLDNLLSEVLNPDQYEKDFKPYPNRADKVEFALKIPGSEEAAVYIPIDAKLPLTDFEKLQNALADNQMSEVKKYRSQLDKTIKKQAKDISSKYINPPITTNFAIMYLPLESLYAEISQKTDLIEELRQIHNVTVAGPSTILPMLGLLNMGYQSLAMHKQAAQVWAVLIETQTEIIQFSGLMEKARKRIDEAGNVIEDASSKTRKIENKFKKVQNLNIEPLEIEKNSNTH